MHDLAVDRVEDALFDVTGRGIANHMALCPAHADQKPSLSVTQTDDRVLLRCHAGCTINAIVDALHLTLSELHDEPFTPESMNSQMVTADYVYQDADGKPAHKNQRCAGKKFFQYRSDGVGGWQPGLNGCELFPYHLPEILASPADAVVYVCEGEKDVEAIRRAGGIATCNTGGVGMGWKPEYDRYFDGRQSVVIVADKDEPGERHARNVYNHLTNVVPSVVIVQAKEGKDAFDHLVAGHGLNDFEEVSDRAPVVSMPLATVADLATPTKPVMRDEAYYGVAGGLLEVIKPESEADPVALLMDLAASFGNCAGLSAYSIADGARHAPRLFSVLVGRTAKARKGTSRAVIHNVMKVADPEWAAYRVVDGLGSGEGLISAVSDPKVTEEGKDIGGSRDRRLYVAEGEFARVLNVAAREGSTLSAIIRQAFPSRSFTALSPTHTLKATGAHISILGHITYDELRQCLKSVDISNGFANRFLFMHVERSNRLPEGGNLDEAAYARLGGILRSSIVAARTVTLVSRTEKAKVAWAEMYDEIYDDDPGGLIGALTSRMEAHLLRLSIVFALFEGVGKVTVSHLRAAKAVVDYSRQSIEFLFGDMTGDTVADRLYAELEARFPGGMDQTEQSNLFSRHADKQRLDAARTLLEKRGLIVSEPEDTGGRPRIVSYAAIGERSRESA